MSKALLMIVLWFAFMGVVALIHAVRAEGVAEWGAVAIITIGKDASLGVTYGHDPFKSKEECDAFRASDATYLAANAKLEAEAKALGVEIKFLYVCLPLKVKAGQTI